MSDKLDRFTKRARRVLTLAQEEALRHNHDAISTEHLLLALVRDENSTAVKVLRELKVEPGQVTRAVERSVQHGKTPILKKPVLSPLLKRVIELAVDEARLMGHHYIGTEHFLLALVRQGEGTTLSVLRAFGVNLDTVRVTLARHLLRGEALASEIMRAPSPEQAERSTKQTPLSPLRYDLTEMAQLGKLDPLIGRDNELEQIIQILSRRTKNNPVLIGEPGVGKRTLVRGLAQRMVEGRVPPALLDRRLLVLDGSQLVTSIVYGELVEKRLQLIVEKGAAPTSLLFIDNIHRMVAATGSSIDLVNVIKLAINRGELQVIGATTPSQYRKYIDREAARDWYLQPVEIKEASIDETIQILRGLKSRYEAHHQLRIEDESLIVAAHLAAHHLADRFLPEKAIDLLDEASSRVHMRYAEDAEEWRETFVKLKQVRQQKQEAFEAQRFDDAIDFRQREVELEAELANLRDPHNEANKQLKVTVEDVAEAVALSTGVAIEQLRDEARTHLHRNE
jgi:ATP-dependent Clp protease ATP-binding subunit ClpC